MSFCDVYRKSRIGGCAAKVSPLRLRELCAALDPRPDDNLLVGIGTSDDAAVYRLTDELALVQTIDFIPPICEDPYLYGQIAAANALSDVWAMGGRPLTALNVCSFPNGETDSKDLAAILRGGLSKIEEAGAALVGGHTIQADETFYGLAVTGIVDPKRVSRNSGARPGNVLVLTKPIGSGLHVSAAKRGVLPADRLRSVLECLAVLNKTAHEVLSGFDVRAATDVSGYGLAGHALRIAEESGVALRLYFERIPIFPGTLDLIDAGVTTAATQGNAALAEGRIRFSSLVAPGDRSLFYDPQTSGGLLVAVEKKDAEGLVAQLRSRGVDDAAIVGEAFPSDSPHLEVVRG